jgi:hypothetical protein
LRDVDGEPVALDDLLERPLAVPLVRYYGCMPCRDFLHQLEAARPTLVNARRLPPDHRHLWRVRHNRDIRTFVAGLATLTFAWFALRTLH